MRKYFESMKIYFGSNINFGPRLKILSHVMNSKSLAGCLKDKVVPVYYIYNDERIIIGYVKDIHGKLIVKSAAGHRKLHLYADIVFDTTNEDILRKVNDYAGNRVERYRLKFISEKVVEDLNEMIKGFIIYLNV